MGADVSDRLAGHPGFDRVDEAAVRPGVIPLKDQGGHDLRADAAAHDAVARKAVAVMDVGMAGQRAKERQAASCAVDGPAPGITEGDAVAFAETSGEGCGDVACARGGAFPAGASQVTERNRPATHPGGNTPVGHGPVARNKDRAVGQDRPVGPAALRHEVRDGIADRIVAGEDEDAAVELGHGGRPGVHGKDHAAGQDLTGIGLDEGGAAAPEVGHGRFFKDRDAALQGDTAQAAHQLCRMQRRAGSIQGTTAKARRIDQGFDPGPVQFGKGRLAVTVQGVDDAAPAPVFPG